MTIVLELAFERLGRAVDAAERCEIIKALDWVMDTGFTIGIALGGVTVGLSEDLKNFGRKKAEEFDRIVKALPKCNVDDNLRRFLIQREGDIREDEEDLGLLKETFSRVIGREIR